MSIEDLLKTAWGCNMASINWNNVDFNRYEDKIIEGVTKSAEQSYYAGKDWNDERFLPFAKKIAQGVAQDAKWSYNAGRDWSEEKFLLVAEILARGIAQNSEYSCDVGEFWRDEKFLPMEKKMVQGVSQSAEWCYQAGRNWGNDRFEPHWWTLVQGLDDEHKVKARINWPGPRKYSPFFTQETPNTYFQYDEKGREGWYRLIGYCDTQLFLDLQPSEFRTLAKAYELVRDKIEDNAISFYDGLNQVLEDGTVREWSQHIIDHYQKPTIGGDTYERVS